MSKKSDPKITLEILTAKFPATFFIDAKKRQPLKIAIHFDLFAAGTRISNYQLRRALQFYGNSAGYLKSVFEGAVRIDLAGELSRRWPTASSGDYYR
jgi:sRNA-binding protein